MKLVTISLNVVLAMLSLVWLIQKKELEPLIAFVGFFYNIIYSYKSNISQTIADNSNENEQEASRGEGNLEQVIGTGSGKNKQTIK